MRKSTKIAIAQSNRDARISSKIRVSDQSLECRLRIESITCRSWEHAIDLQQNLLTMSSFSRSTGLLHPLFRDQPSQVGRSEDQSEGDPCAKRVPKHLQAPFDSECDQEEVGEDDNEREQDGGAQR
jgi:hypothetical protein